MPKILFVAAHRLDRSPSQRFRFEQYLDYLESNGFEWELSYLIDRKDDKRFYSKGNYFHKLRVLLKSIRKRKYELKRLDEFDLIYIQREAFMTGTIKYEQAYAASSAKVVYDFDDSVWLTNVSDGNRNLKFLKDPGKTEKIIGLADMVFAGNQYLADYASKFNQTVRVVPTTIDTNYHQKVISQNEDQICIGWTGSTTTIQHFEMAIPFLEKLKEKYGGRICFQVIGDKNYKNVSLGIDGVEWNRETEIEDLSAIDIGIMPLPDDEWAKGKCGCKGLQYMALEIPAVMSPVGVNAEIIENNINGFTATTTDEWVEKISNLIDSEELRRQIGKAGRLTVLEQYSVLSQRENYIHFFNEVLQS